MGIRLAIRTVRVQAPRSDRSAAYGQAIFDAVTR